MKDVNDLQNENEKLLQEKKEIEKNLKEVHKDLEKQKEI